MKIYAASSWRNPWQQPVVAHLRSLGHDVYDFRNPPNGSGFGWRELDPNWQRWSPAEYRQNLEKPRAREGFESDFKAMRECDACVLIQPCGTSAHLELGWCAGAGLATAVYFPLDTLPDLSSVGHVGSATGRTTGIPCTACGDLEGCHLPGRLHQIEPELMVKLSDALLLGRVELEDWLKKLDARPRTAGRLQVGLEIDRR